MEHLVLCPGSRSGPIALAAGILSKFNNLEVSTCIDERSAAFLALGISTAKGKASVVVTTSGSAVAHLLPAAIEADRSVQPILFITADRPIRLKECGSNQTVNQEDFLFSVCRSFDHGPEEGLHLLNSSGITDLVERSWHMAHYFPGPVHLNLPLEEPLHASLEEQKEICKSFFESNSYLSGSIYQREEPSPTLLPKLDPLLPGVVIVGPWRGLTENLLPFRDALRTWQLITGWAIFADPLSGICSDQPGLISYWEMLIGSGIQIPKDGLQVLRLGPMPSSRLLNDWLSTLGNNQVLITEGDQRRLDPLNLSSQWSRGFASWLERMINNGLLSEKTKKSVSTQFLNTCQSKDRIAEGWLDSQLTLAGSIDEIVLARWLARLLPSDIPIMLAASSPVRDWLSFAGKEALNRQCFGFRGASGIDGTLSLGMGLSMALGRTVLITGDLAMLHDTNGWLCASSKQPPLVVLLIDNGGGGIFTQLDLQTESNKTFEKLFSMPQSIDFLSLAQTYGIAYRQVSCLEDLQASLDWSFSKPSPTLLRFCTNACSDASKRKNIRMGLTNQLQDFQHNKH